MLLLLHNKLIVVYGQVERRQQGMYGRILQNDKRFVLSTPLTALHQSHERLWELRRDYVRPERLSSVLNVRFGSAQALVLRRVQLSTDLVHATVLLHYRHSLATPVLHNLAQILQRNLVLRRSSVYRRHLGTFAYFAYLQITLALSLC